jgi:hypothetical protein
MHLEAQSNKDLLINKLLSDVLVADESRRNKKYTEKLFFFFAFFYLTDKTT